MSELRRIYCNTCRVHTNHELKSVHYRYLNDTSLFKQLEFVESETFDARLDFDESLGVSRYQTWICRGCDSATLQESATLDQL
jgi:hypothetical protein